MSKIHAFKYSKNCQFTHYKFRISAHPLNIERGRYSKPKTPREQRSCKFCIQVGDEFHFILLCPKYCYEREILCISFNINFYDISCNNSDENICRFLNPSITEECYMLYIHVDVHFHITDMNLVLHDILQNCQ